MTRPIMNGSTIYISDGTSFFLFITTMNVGAARAGKGEERKKAI